MRYWHIHFHDCYPKGCESDDGYHIPNLLVSKDEYRLFLKEFNKFCRWTKKMRYYLKVSFAGIIDRIQPYFSIRMVGNSPIFECRDFVLIFKQGMLQKEYFEDPFYVILSWEVLEGLNLKEKDAISGQAQFHIDKRGIITLDKVSRLRLVNSFFPDAEWDIHQFNGVNLRILDSIHQDLCMECPYRFLGGNLSVKGGKRSNAFVCTLKSCIQQQEKDADQESYIPSLSDPEDNFPLEKISNAIDH
jgi:hypothetical protein